MSSARAANGSVESGSSLSLRPMGLAPQPADLTAKSLARALPHSWAEQTFRRAMVSMIDDAGKQANTGDEGRPSYWAPFIVVGDGGAGK
jgi:hypothetical protein